MEGRVSAGREVRTSVAAVADSRTRSYSGAARNSGASSNGQVDVFLAFRGERFLREIRLAARLSHPHYTVEAGEGLARLTAEGR
jgi:hypothetical protein